MASQPLSNRSLRFPAANTSKPLSDNQPSSTQTHLALFLTNIRLLDLDLRSDWPDITAVTFSTKDAQQNQKKRITCVEWVLYQLFFLWDEEETRNKLAPFFPPLEPLQSINLRAALFRCLDQAKKRGVLGRDTVLRKTMLDECKGERLEEILSVFSTAVLKKVALGEQNSYNQPIAVQLAIESFSYMAERDVIATLNLAHRGVLGNDLRKRQLRAAQLGNFAELLDLKDRQIIRREDELKELKAARGGQDCIMTEESGRSLAKLQKNWSGDDDWLQTIIHGDGRFEKQGLLAQPYDEAWKRVANGCVAEADEGKKKGLLDQLDARVKQQNHRLAKWQSSRKSLSKAKEAGKTPSGSSTTLHRSKRGIDLNFGGHESLQINQKALEKAEAPTLVLCEAYNLLVAKMEHDLAQAGRTASNRPSGRSNRQKWSPKSESPESADEKDDMMVSRQTVADSPSPPEGRKEDEDGWDRTDFDEQSGAGVSIPPINSINPITGSRTSSCESTPSDPNLRRESQSDESGEQRKAAESTQRRQNRNSVSTMPPPTKPIAPKEAPVRPLDPDCEVMADEILSSMATTSPSPMKPKPQKALSLAERTRMSMARVSQSDFDDISDLSPVKSNTLPSSSKPTSRVPEEGDLHADLISRTRQSMAGFAAAQKKAEADKQRSIKDAAKKARESSYFPPPFSADAEEENGSEGWEQVDRAGLIEGNVDADYESVFKSRPKIALSPAGSPQVSPKKWDLEDEQLEDFEEEMSPMRRLGG